MFRNATIFAFSPAVGRDLERLDSALTEHPLRPCGPAEISTRGFVPPVGQREDAPMVHGANGCSLLSVGAESKLLPAAVVNEEVRKRVLKIADEEGRRVSGRERKRIKDEVFDQLLPRAFTKTSRTLAYADPAEGWFVIDAGSRKVAENVVGAVREALGSFPAVPLAPEQSPRLLLTEWVASGQLPADLALGDECEFRDPAQPSGARWRGRAADLDADDAKEHLRAGAQVFQLGLVFKDRISFVLAEDLSVKKLRFLDVVMDELGHDFDDDAAAADAQLAMMTLELRVLFRAMGEWFQLTFPTDTA